MSNLKNYNNTNVYENQNLEFKVNRNENNKGFFFVISIVFFTLGFLLSCLKALIYFKQKSQYFDIPYATGYSIGTIIISLAIIASLFLLSTRVFKKKILLIIFSIIFMLGCFTSTIFAIRTSFNEAKMNKAAKDKFIIMCNNAANEKEVTEESFDKSVYGNFTPLLSLTNEYFIKFQKNSNDTSKDIDSLELDSILSANGLSSTEEINNSKKKINDCMNIFDKHESEYNDLINNFISSASSLELPKQFKNGMLEGYNKSQIETCNKIRNLFKVERDFCTKVNELMDFMLAIQGKYIVQDDQVIFESEDDLNKFNEYVTDIQGLAQKETDIRNGMLETLKLKLDEFQEYK